MRVLLDECVDWRLARDIRGHEVKTARQMRWNAISNGELLALTSKHFDCFLTVDQNLAYQQPPGSVPIAVFVLKAHTNRLADLKPLVPKLLTALRSPLSRTITVIEGD